MKRQKSDKAASAARNEKAASEKAAVVINIYGGVTQILPGVTKAVRTVHVHGCGNGAEGRVTATIEEEREP